VDESKPVFHNLPNMPPPLATAMPDSRQPRRRSSVPDSRSRSRSPRRSISPRSASPARSHSRSRSRTPRGESRNGVRGQSRSRDVDMDREARGRRRTRSPTRSVSPTPRSSKVREQSSTSCSETPFASAFCDCSEVINSSTITDVYQIVVEKLTKNVTTEHLYEIFENFGRIVDVDLLMNHAHDRNRGTAYIIYETQDEAEEAFKQMHGASLDGATIDVHLVVPRNFMTRSPPPRTNNTGSAYSDRRGSVSGPPGSMTAPDFYSPPRGPGGRGPAPPPSNSSRYSGRFRERSPIGRRSPPQGRRGFISPRYRGPPPRAHDTYVGTGRGRDYYSRSHSRSRSRSLRRSRSPVRRSRSPARRSRSPYSRGRSLSRSRSYSITPPHRYGRRNRADSRSRSRDYSPRGRRRSPSYSSYGRSDRSHSRDRDGRR
jgi:RNA-binding protein with serine-rich domain 1